MDREELAKMKLEALRLLAQERGVDGARTLGKAELIDQLAPKTIVERAQEAVAHAVEVVKEVVSHPSSVVRSGTDEAKQEPKAPHPANGFGVPSATVHHAAPHGVPR